jgi:hypothetical protein
MVRTKKAKKINRTKSRKRMIGGGRHKQDWEKNEGYFGKIMDQKGKLNRDEICRYCYPSDYAKSARRFCKVHDKVWDQKTNSCRKKGSSKKQKGGGRETIAVLVWVVVILSIIYVEHRARQREAQRWWDEHRPGTRPDAQPSLVTEIIRAMQRHAATPGHAAEAQVAAEQAQAQTDVAIDEDLASQMGAPLADRAPVRPPPPAGGRMSRYADLSTSELDRLVAGLREA